MQQGSDELGAVDFRLLEVWQADRIQHPGGTLLAHLKRTATLLRTWNAAPHVVAAGLHHAAYGTDGFAQALIGLGQRDELRGAIGERAEALVYLYASCDRSFTYPKVGVEVPPRVRDRFCGRVYDLSEQELRDFVELTYANELDIVQQNEQFARDVGYEVADLFERWRVYASVPAQRTFDALLGPFKGRI